MIASDDDGPLKHLAGGADVGRYRPTPRSTDRARRTGTTATDSHPALRRLGKMRVFDRLYPDPVVPVESFKAVIVLDREPFQPRAAGSREGQWIQRVFIDATFAAWFGPDCGRRSRT